ncbi:phosphotransferase [Asanoa sp. NPDC049573]|uniref:phosphotransferase n=1 Tax=Asanoa sp. NPDC049573 TaxID=3155396 RepID=UPI0034367FD7
MVRRRQQPSASYVHQLLAHLAANDWSGAPRFLGIDDEGRAVLTYLDGHVPWSHDLEPGVRSDVSLARVAGLLREFHDLTAGAGLAGAGALVCHNDLSPKNTVYRSDGEGLLPIAFIDWDLAGPGERIHDIGHVCWQFVRLGPGADPVDAGRGARLVCGRYGLADRSRVVETILWNMFLVGRHTRADEESGRAELVRSARVGRGATLAAALGLALLANLAVALLLIAVTAGTGLPAAGSILFGVSVDTVGLTFAALTAVAAQVFENVRAAYGAVGLTIGAAFVLRAAGDAACRPGS